MTSAEHTAQRDLVTASLAAVHHPDTYPISRTGDQRTADGNSSRERGSVADAPSHGARTSEASRAGRSGHPTRPCEYCDGKGTKTDLNGSEWRCFACKGRGRLIDQPTPRVIPNTRRFM